MTLPALYALPDGPCHVAVEGVFPRGELSEVLDGAALRAVVSDFEKWKSGEKDFRGVERP